MMLYNRLSLTVLLTLLAIGASASRAAGQGERTSEYLGRLVGADAIASAVDVRITFYAPDGGRELSTLDKPGVKVVDGLFKVPLEVPEVSAKAPSKGMDFEVKVRVPAGSSGPFTSLSGRANLPPKIYDVASDALRVDALGNVGLGTDSPTARLDVNGSMRAASIEAAGGVIAGGVSSVLGLEVRAPGGTPVIDFSSDANVDYNARLWYDKGANRLQLENTPLWAGQYWTGNGGGLWSEGRMHISSTPDETVYINPWHGTTIIGAQGKAAIVYADLTANGALTVNGGLLAGGDLNVKGAVHFDKGLTTDGGVMIMSDLAVNQGVKIGGQLDCRQAALGELRCDRAILGGNLEWPGRGHIQTRESLYLNPFAGGGTVFIGGGGGSGDLYVTGTLAKAAGSFKIDHPLDPENKFLSHSFVESPDMKNIYDGVATTDASGYATIALPDYFEALNQDFRYQLTVIDEADDSDGILWAKVVRKIEDNQFKIRTARGNIEVSWQVTGIRHDAYARKHPIQTETDKNAEERGLYLNPEAFDQPAEMGIYFNGAQDEASSSTTAGEVVNSADPLATVIEQR